MGGGWPLIRAQGGVLAEGETLGEVAPDVLKCRTTTRGLGDQGVLQGLTRGMDLSDGEESRRLARVGEGRGVDLEAEGRWRVGLAEHLREGGPLGSRRGAEGESPRRGQWTLVCETAEGASRTGPLRPALDPSAQRCGGMGSSGAALASSAAPTTAGAPQGRGGLARVDPTAN